MNHTANVPGMLVEAIDSLASAGAFKFSNDDRALTYVCPCGCEDWGWLPLAPLGGHAHWQWDGNRERPTLTPSIRRLNHCKWHGHLIAGVWQPAGDSGQGASKSAIACVSCSTAQTSLGTSTRSRSKRRQGRSSRRRRPKT